MTAGTWKKFPEDIGTEPQIIISVEPESFATSPPKDAQKVESIDGGNYYLQLGAPISPTIFDLPYENGNKILRMMLISAGEGIRIFNETNKTNIKDADEATFREMISTFKFF